MSDDEDYAPSKPASKKRAKDAEGVRAEPAAKQQKTLSVSLLSAWLRRVLTLSSS